MTELKFMKGFCEEVTELYAPSSQAAEEEDRYFTFKLDSLWLDKKKNLTS